MPDAAIETCETSRVGLVRETDVMGSSVCRVLQPFDSTHNSGTPWQPCRRSTFSNP
jgi:hypothetical protein